MRIFFTRDNLHRTIGFLGSSYKSAGGGGGGGGGGLGKVDIEKRLNR